MEEASIGHKRARQLQAAPIGMSRCRWDGAKTWFTKEFQAGLLGIGQSLAIPVRLQPPQLGIRQIGVKNQPPASRQLDYGWHR